MFSWYRIWMMLTTKLDMLPDSWLKHYLNDTTQHAYCVTQALTHGSRTKWELFCWRFFNVFFVWKLLSCDLNFTEMYPKVPINNKSMLVQIMAQWPTGGKPGQQIDAKSSATTKLKKSAKRTPLLAQLEPHFLSNELWKYCDDSCYFELC